jgi:hypothetical protein
MPFVFSPVSRDRRKSPPPNPGQQDSGLMGSAVRLFLVEDDGYLRSLPLAWCERLLRGEPEGRFPQYAGTRVSYALVVVDLVDRKPIERVSSARYKLQRATAPPAVTHLSTILSTAICRDRPG